MTITVINPMRAARDARLVTVCTTCNTLCAETATPGVFAHIDDSCRECFGTDQRCPYPELHGVHEYHKRGVGRTVCAEAIPHECDWCHHVLDAAEYPCPDHPNCCGCCDPR